MRFTSLMRTVILSVLAWSAPVRGQEEPGPLTLRTGDQLVLQVRNEPGWSGRFTVGPEGSVMLPVIGIVPVVGRPFSEVEHAIQRGYALELAEPDILVTPLYRVSVIGEVRVPGFHFMDETGTLADLFVMSGGLLPTASRKKIRLVRGGQETEVKLDESGAAPRLPLRSGDQLVVGRRSWVSENLPIFIGAAASVAAAAVTSIIVK